MAAVRAVDIDLNDGVIDLFSGVWICQTHETKMKPGNECAFCAVDREGMEVLQHLASRAS
ncbi:hypothetical protein GCM10010423_64990 [Streptomyces levis]|uniref:Uncharacterized protein n=1 Tax=Streptomyces levis TaxID=285566 RepID=A0ABP6BBL4_9ACTN